MGGPWKSPTCPSPRLRCARAGCREYDVYVHSVRVSDQYVGALKPRPTVVPYPYCYSSHATALQDTRDVSQEFVRPGTGCRFRDIFGALKLRPALRWRAEGAPYCRALPTYVLTSRYQPVPVHAQPVGFSEEVEEHDHARIPARHVEHALQARQRPGGEAHACARSEQLSS